MATPIQSYAGQATVASKVEAEDARAGRQQRQGRLGQRGQGVGGDLHGRGDVGPRRVEEAAAEAALRREPDGVQHPVEAVDVLAEPTGQRGQLLVVGDVELDHRGRLRQPAGDPGGEATWPGRTR